MTLPWRVEKQPYSRDPWRIVHAASGLVITITVPYPGQEEMPPIEVAGFPRKRDAVAYAETLDWSDIEKRIEAAA